MLGVYRSRLGITVLLALASCFPLSAKAEDGAGRYFFPRRSDVKVRAMPQEDANVVACVLGLSPLKPHEVRDGWLHVESGWIRISDVAPLDEAAKFFNAAIKQSPSAHAYESMALIDLVNEEPESARKNCESALRLEPASATAFALRGLAFELQGDSVEAIKSYTAALQFRPDDVEVRLWRATACMENNDCNSAERDLTEIIRLDPANDAAYKLRIGVFEAVGEFEKALEDCNTFIARGRSDPLVYAARATLQVELGRYEQAAGDCEQSIRLDANCAPAYMTRAQLRIRNNDARGAVEDCDIAIRSDPKLAASYYWRAKARNLLGSYDEAIEDINTNLTIASATAGADVYAERGYSFIMQEDFQRALLDFSEAIRRDPQHVYALRGRAHAYQMLGQPVHAARDLTEAARLAKALGDSSSKRLK